MDTKKFSRKEKEALFIKKFTELQIRWGNPVGPSDPTYRFNSDGYWRFVEKWTDDELEKQISDTVGQLKFEKSISTIKTIFKTIIIIFVLLGIGGLLLFGMRQLF